MRGGGKQAHPGTWWWRVRTSQSWQPLYAGGLTLSDLGFYLSLGQNGLNDKLNVGEWFCAHIHIHFGSSWVRKKDGKVEEPTLWGAVGKNDTFWFAKTPTAAVTLSQQHGGAAAGAIIKALQQPQQHHMLTERSAIKGSVSLHFHLPVKLMKTRRALPLVAWYWPKLRVFYM